MFYSPEELVALGIAEKKPDGAIRITDFEAFEALPFNRMMNVVRVAYMKVNNLPNVMILQQQQVQEILSVWFSCTRSVSASDPRFKDTNSLKAYHTKLGILSADGSLNEDRIEKLAQIIWADPNHFPDFETLKRA